MIVGDFVSSDAEYDVAASDWSCFFYFSLGFLSIRKNAYKRRLMLLRRMPCLFCGLLLQRVGAVCKPLVEELFDVLFEGQLLRSFFFVAGSSCGS